MGHIYAMRGAYILSLRSLLHLSEYATIALLNIPLTSLAVLIASQGENGVPSAYLSLGVAVTVIWGVSVFWMGYSLGIEFELGTVDHNLASRTPLMLIMLGKALAIATLTIPSAAVGSILVIVVSDNFTVASPGLAIVSGLIAVLGAAAVCFSFAPLLMLSRGRGSMFFAFSPFGIVFGGFFYPVSELSRGVEAIGRFMPTPWAMDGVMRSVQPGGMSWSIAGDWAVSLVLIVAFLGLTYVLFRLVERRIRVTGSLGTF